MNAEPNSVKAFRYRVVRGSRDPHVRYTLHVRYVIYMHTLQWCTPLCALSRTLVRVNYEYFLGGNREASRVFSKGGKWRKENATRYVYIH